MYPRELIGKKAVRTGPVNYGSRAHFMTGQKEEHKDYSYTTDPLIILQATDSHIVVQHPPDSYAAKCGTNAPRLLDCRWIDDQWADYDLILQGINSPTSDLPECAGTELPN
jgi:hypothetical protein